MSVSKSQKKALTQLNYDLFRPENVTPPAPATIDSRIRKHQSRLTVDDPAGQFERFVSFEVTGDQPIVTILAIDELYRLFDYYNKLYFGGKLPPVRIQYSTRMSAAGSYTPEKKLIRISRRYHELFPDEIHDTLKHEMIHIRHFRHDSAFRREAARVGASLKAKSHPALRKPAKYIYLCPSCSKEYPRQKILRMASCGTCSKGGKFDIRFKLSRRR